MADAVAAAAPDLIPGTIPYLRQFTNLPLGAYPNVGYYLDPGWEYDPSMSPAAYLEDARSWVSEGATVVGGCCGTTPEHIAALAEAFGHRPARLSARID